MSEVVEDRISSLPASILHHILSFVDTRDAARTSVLSKLWKYMWRSIPILHLVCHNSLKVDKFVDFVDRTLELHDESSIQKFSLVSNFQLNEPRIKKWISTVVSHNVEELSLTLNRRDVVLIPSSLYYCESLVHLVLHISPRICFPKYISFPRLETLMLFGIEFRDEGWNEQLFSNCPVLRILMMANCTWSDMKSFCISNPSLRSLFIFGMEEEEDGLGSCALKIHAPSLEFLVYVGRITKDYILSSFPKLAKVKVDFFFEENGAMWEHEIDYGAVLSKFFQAIAHVLYLTISGRTLQVISVADSLLNNLPSLPNLHMLGLTQKLIADTDKALIAFLEKAPNLGSLYFEGFAPPFPDEEEEDNGDSGDDGSEDNCYDEDGDESDASEGDDEHGGWALDMMATRCSFLHHLKFVFFEIFTGNAREMRWLKLILNNAKALEEMDISFDTISHGKSKKLVADILRLPRASASCVFKFSPKQS